MRPTLSPKVRQRTHPGFPVGGSNLAAVERRLGSSDNVGRMLTFLLLQNFVLKTDGSWARHCGSCL